MKLSVLFKRIQHAVIQMPELEEDGNPGDYL